MFRTQIIKFIKGMVALLGGQKANALTCLIAEEIAPIHVICGTWHKELRFYCPNRMALWRARSLYEKEPETIRWINGFTSSDALLDIGANVGVFTLYAAMRGHRVVSVEPESQNYSLLNANLYLNGLDKTVQAFNVALADENRASTLYLSEFGAARALHTVGREENYQHERITAAFRQGVWQLTLDHVLASIGDFFPNHIKIDVDGAEARIIVGAKVTLRDTRLKSILIELNEDLADDRALIDVFSEAGFRMLAREHAEIVHHGKFKSGYNFIFGR